VSVRRRAGWTILLMNVHLIEPDIETSSSRLASSGDAQPVARRR
jgi:hypothetical protein